MTTSAVGNQIIFNFAWQGSNTWHGGMANDGLSADRVCLEFGGAKTKISVDLPQNIAPTEVHELSFTCRRNNQVNGQIKITHPQSLQATPEQMRQLTVKVRVLEKGDPIGPRMLNAKTGRITQQQTAEASHKDVHLEMPEELEIGQIYQLRVISNDFDFSAHLIKDHTKKAPTPLPPLPPVDAQLVADQADLGESLEGVLGPLMMFTISKLSSPSLFLSARGRTPTSGLTIIIEEIKTIERIQFNQLIAKIRQIKQTTFITEWGKEILKESIAVIGHQGLINIMHAKLKDILGGQIPAHLESKVNQLCEEFKQDCMRQAWS